MLSITAVINDIFGTYLDSLKKDLFKNGHKIILLLLSITWLGSPIIALILFLLGKFLMPSNPYFYLFWFLLALLTVIQFTLFIIGMSKTKFLAANTFSNLTFVMTIIYAALLLHETLNIFHFLAVGLGFIGAIIFFNWKTVNKNEVSSNTGLVLILFSVLLAPLESIFYKKATFYTISFSQFLTGRVVMDMVYYSFFFLLLFVFWYKKNPFAEITSFACSIPAIIFTIGSVIFHLVDSYLFFKLPVSLLAIIGIVSIPAGYFIGPIKYKEKINAKYIIGALLIILALILFIKAGYIE